MKRSGGKRRERYRPAVQLSLFLLAALPAAAAVVDSAPDHFTVQSVLEVPVSRAQVYQAFVANVGSWWHPDHTFSGDPSRMSLDARATGCLCEQLDAGSVRHMTVVYVDAGRLIRLEGGLGPLQAEAVVGAMSWSFEDQDEGSRVIVTYKVSGSASVGLDEWAPTVDQVLAQAAERLARFVATGSPD